MKRILTRNTERTIYEMEAMFSWCIDMFGGRDCWRYGKAEDWAGSTFCNGSYEIEFMDFRDEEDATMFILKWS